MNDRLAKILNAVKNALKGIGDSTIDFDQKTVDKWLAGLDAVLAKAEGRTETKQEVKQENTQEAKVEPTSVKAETKADTLIKAEVEAALEDIAQAIQGNEREINETENDLLRTAATKELKAYRGAESRMKELQSKLNSGKALSQSDMDFLDSVYKDLPGLVGNAWVRARLQRTTQQRQTQEVKAKKAETQQSGIKYRIEDISLTKAQKEAFDEYVQNALAGAGNNSKSYISIGEASPRLVADLKKQGIDISGRTHIVRDNDIRHIRNRHGIFSKNNGYNEYGVTTGDIQAIPYIVENYAEVRPKFVNGKLDSLIYALDYEDTTYYAESSVVAGEDKLAGKQMIKCPYGEIPEQYKDVYKERSTYGYPDKAANAVPESYVQDVPQNNASKSIVPQTVQNVKMKFSLDSAVEETRDLIAVHNVSERNLLKTLKLGGFPAVSIAVTKAKNGWSPFGDISVVFGKETIDPEASADNHVYGEDAWTPEFPYARQYVPAIDTYYTAPGAYLDGTLEERLNEDLFDNKLSESDFFEAYRHDAAMMQEFHRDTEDTTVPVIYKERRLETAGQERIDVAERIVLDVLGQEDMNSFLNMSPQDVALFMAREDVKKISDAILQSGRFGILANRSYGEVIEYIFNKLRREVDIAASTKKIIENTNAKEYEDWLKDYYTKYSKGHFVSAAGEILAPTADNAVAVMKSKNSVSEKASLEDAYVLLTREYKSVDDIRQDKERLSANPIRRDQAVINRFVGLMNQIMANNSVYDSTSEEEYIREIAAVVRKSEKGSSLQQLKQLQKDLRNATGLRISAEQVKELVSVRDAVWSAETSLFEAKPMRNMPLSEAKLVIAPEGTSQELLDALNKNNIPVETYEAGNEQARLDLLNGATAQKYMFAVDREFDYSLEALREKHKNGVKVPVLSLKVLDEIKGSSLQAEAIKRAQAAGRIGTNKKTAYIEFGEEKASVLVDFDSFKHGAGDKSDLYKAVCLHLPAIAKNAVAVNSIEGKANHQYPATVYLALVNIGTGKEGYEQVAVRMIVEQGRAKEIRLYAIRKEAPDSSASVRTQPTPTSDTTLGSLRKKGASKKVSSTTISIDNFLNIVKEYNVGRTTLSKDVADKLGFRRENDVKVTPYLRYALDKDFLRDTVKAIDTKALEGKLFALSGVKNLKGLGIWLKEPSRIFDAIAGDDKELRNALHEIFEKPHSDATGRYASNIQKMQARVEQIAIDAGALTVNKKGKKTFHEDVSAAIQNYGEGYQMKDVDNLNPTSNSDIRFSLNDSFRTDQAIRKVLGKAVEGEIRASRAWGRRFAMRTLACMGSGTLPCTQEKGCAFRRPHLLGHLIPLSHAAGL